MKNNFYIQGPAFFPAPLPPNPSPTPLHQPIRSQLEIALENVQARPDFNGIAERTAPGSAVDGNFHYEHRTSQRHMRTGR